MSLLVQQLPDVTLVVFPNESLTADNASAIRNELERHVPPGRRALLDLSQVQYVDSSGCGVLLQLHRRLRETGGELRVCGVVPAVRALFEQLRLSRVLAIHSGRTTALRLLRS